MPEYTVHRLEPQSSGEHLPTFAVEHFYSSDYTAETKGRLFFREGAGFELAMWCMEENPRAIYHNPNDPVHTDSCMEAFINFYPQLPELGYLNIEMNAAQAARCSFGTGRHTRNFVVSRNLPHPETRVEFLRLDGKPAWRVSALIRLELLQALYGRCDFPTGHKMRGNFYKCGDHTARPHWGSWAPISKLDFHSPSCFGTLFIA